ncbi:hypothetical protein [Frigoriglobus tundricola]|uniref:Uncharacterized protein n=1 Tax=Frigoriglobus tundricola TaxID=2774151 RepID=A0A6M5YXZ8_9BACT|nr:hypothetical protein [Frigoriglobus tundricola]QJW98889.1 hypothetical protein FTUN_6484 [Frigoriglobus tundricola]
MSETQTPDAPETVGAPVEATECPRECRRHAARGPLWAAVGWLSAAFAAVLVAIIPYDPGESLCGPWGCFPPLLALVSMHLLWFVALGAGTWAVARWLPGLLRPLGFVLLLAGVVATGVLVTNDLAHWLSKMPDDIRQLWPKRIGYRLLTLSDVPLVQSILVGALCVVRGRGARA